VAADAEGWSCSIATCGLLARRSGGISRMACSGGVHIGAAV
jgi:hypothetical protein